MRRNKIIPLSIIHQLKNSLHDNIHLIKNFIALGLLQATNFLIPLITFPYLVRIVGIEKFGIISYGLTIITYLIAIADYGFNLSATRSVSIHRDNSDKLSELFASVMTTKLILFGLSVIIMGILCVTIERIQAQSVAYMLGLLCVLGNVLMPVWFFQGLERMKFITYANLIAKLIQLGLLFICVKHEKDYIFVLGLYGFANIVSGIYSLRLAATKCQIRIHFSSIHDVLEQLRSGWYFFSSTLTISIANTATIIILGYFVSNTEIGYYSLAEKIVFVAWTVLGLYSQAVFPTICKLAQQSFSQVYEFTKKVTVPFIVLVGLSCCLVYVFSGETIELIAGHRVESASNILRILIVVPFVVALNIPPYQILLAYDYKKIYAALFNGSAVVNIMLCTALVYVWGVVGAAVCMVITQTFITLSLYVALAFKLKQLVKMPTSQEKLDTSSLQV